MLGIKIMVVMACIFAQPMMYAADGRSGLDIQDLYKSNPLVLAMLHATQSSVKDGRQLIKHVLYENPDLIHVQDRYGLLPIDFAYTIGITDVSILRMLDPNMVQVSSGSRAVVAQALLKAGNTKAAKHVLSGVR